MQTGLNYKKSTKKQNGFNMTLCNDMSQISSNDFFFTANQSDLSKRSSEETPFVMTKRKRFEIEQDEEMPAMMSKRPSTAVL